MSKAAPIQSNFNAGEWSPSMEGRVDLQKYGNACYFLENMLPLVQGPARKRSGTRFALRNIDMEQRSWLYPFVFGQDIAYVMEFSEGVIRILKDGNFVAAPSTTFISAATQANPVALTTFAAHGLTTGQMILISGVGGMTQLNGNHYFVTVTGAATLTLQDLDGNNVDGTGYGAFTSGGNIFRAMQVTTPYTEAELTSSVDGTFQLSMVQSADVVYICHGEHITQKLVRVTANDFDIDDLELKGGPFIGVDPDETTTVYASAETGSITIQASSSIFEAGHVGSLFLIEAKNLDDVKQWEVAKSITLNDLRRSGRNVYKALNTATTGTIRPTHTVGAKFDGDTGVQWQYQHSGYGYARITGFTDADTVTATVELQIPSQAVGAPNATTRWSHAAISDVEGWPTHCTFFRERLWFLRGSQAWGSVAADFENFSERDAGEVTADMSIAINFASGEINDVSWVASLDSLIAGTFGNEISISEASVSDPLGPANIRAKVQTSRGGRQVAPAVIDNFALFAQKAGRKLRELSFTYERDGYITNDLTVLSDHIAKGQITQLAYQQEPHSIVWATCFDGSLIGFTYNREQEVLSWHPHLLGGTDVYVESVATIPSSDGDRDEVWLCVRRTVDGATVRYIEVMEKDWVSREGSVIQDAFFSDCGITYDGVATETVTGLGHLNGETVSVFADGSTHPDCIVEDGAIELQREAEVVQVGLKYSGIVATMAIEAGSSEGTAQGRTKRIRDVVFRLLDSKSFKYGPDLTHLDEANFRTAEDDMDRPVPIFTGDKLVTWPSGWETPGRVWLVSDLPEPCTLVSVMPRLHTQE